LRWWFRKNLLHIEAVAVCLDNSASNIIQRVWFREITGLINGGQMIMVHIILTSSLDLHI
jgi:hypothetical protein